MSEKSSSVSRIDEICAEISATMQQLKARVRTYAQDPSDENATAMAREADILSHHSQTVHARLINVVTEHKKA